MAVPGPGLHTHVANVAFHGLAGHIVQGDPRAQNPGTLGGQQWNQLAANLQTWLFQNGWAPGLWMPRDFVLEQWPTSGKDMPALTLQEFWNTVESVQRAGFDWSIDVMGFPATRRNSRPERTIAQGTAREQGLRQLLRQLGEAMRRGIRIPVETTVNELRRFVLLGMNTTVSSYNVHLGYRPHVAFDPELVQMGGRTQRVAFAGRRASRARGIPGWRHVYYLAMSTIRWLVLQMQRGLLAKSTPWLIQISAKDKELISQWEMSPVEKLTSLMF